MIFGQEDFQACYVDSRIEFRKIPKATPLNRRIRPFEILVMSEINSNLNGRPTPFVVFFAGRSGSTHLTSLLHSHPDVVCRKEIFHTVELSEQDASDPRIDQLLVGGRAACRQVFGPQNDMKSVLNPSKGYCQINLLKLIESVDEYIQTPPIPA